MSAEELAKLIVTPESFQNSVNFVKENLLNDTFHPDFTKEITWHLEGLYKKTLQVIQNAIEEIYTPTEIEILLNMHRLHPWMAQKAELLTQKAAIQSADMGEIIAKAIFTEFNIYQPEEEEEEASD